ncbi:MAG: AAA family ATPase, partial [Planctomycetota bacterium]
MDAFDDEPKPDPAGDTKWRPKSGETRVSNPMELRMAPPWESGEKRGDYLIGELLGRGQAGFVYSAINLVSRQRCALKVLCRLSPRDLYRNKLGFRRMAPFRHPCLLRTDRMESIDGRTVLRMEEIIGKTLFLSVKEDLKRLDRAEAYAQLKRLLHDYAYGLMTIHMSNLVHRDLKPTNLMVRAGGGGVIVDYGLVASCDPETDPGGIRPYIAGTPRYFSPEALWEQSYTPAGDVFSLGLVMLDCLHEISGGEVCLSEMRQGEFDNWVRNEDEEGISAAVSVLADEVPPDLRRAVTEMLSVDRALRPTSHELVTMMRDADEGPIRLITNHSLYGRERELSDVLEWLNGIYREGSGRLHVHGESGTGKTRLLDEVERQLSQHSWIQLFRVKCQPWESRTLHVWDQIADQVAARYARHDRTAIRLDHVTMTTLQEAFPQLRHVIQKGEPADSLKDVLDPLAEAMRRLILELRKNGPLIFIIDDAQLADRPSNQLWDRLCDERMQRVGIITSSRSSDTKQNRKPDQSIELGPLDPVASHAMLLHAAHRWSANVNEAGLRELAGYCGHNPFRLSELAEEFRPGGMLHVVESSEDASSSNLGDLDRLWQVRFDRLSKRAKAALVFIATADAAVSMEQLAELTHQSEDIGVSVSELVDQRLVNDDAIGDACLSVMHDTIASGLIENLSAQELRDAHRAWAELLAKANLPRHAARIATHYYAAGDEATALRFAILAAENADRAYAKAEAARWHERVVEHVTGAAKVKHLRDAARCYQEACMPREASKLYLTLADQTSNAGDQIQFSTLALRLLLRCGEMDHARPLIQTLDHRLSFQRDSRLIGLFQGYRARLYRLASQLCLGETPRPDIVSEVRGVGELPLDDWNACRLEYCAAITRPMAMLDFRSMLHSVMTGAELAARHG